MTATGTDRPVAIGADELARMHEALEQACRRGSPGDVPVLGYGEISLVVAWPPEQPRWAVKRLPVFPDDAAVDRYVAVLDRYVAALRERGVDVLDTEAVRVAGHGDAGGDGVTAYLVQPVLPAASLAPTVLATAEPSPDHPLLAHVVDRIAAVVDSRVGLDAHVANWALADDRVVYFDLTTPLLRDGAGHWEVDSRVLAAAVPWALRPAMTRLVIPGIEARYHDPRKVVLDVAVNLLRVRLHPWLRPLLDTARSRTGIDISGDEVREDYRSEARTWRALQAVRRTDRVWQTRVRRRPYPFLIPGRTGW
jgi:hypothetical protein